MTSILTNIGAISALQTLRSIAGQLQNTQNQVSAGLRVGTASDNAAYWSIATTMRSDNGALSAVQDALGLGAAKVDTAYVGTSQVVDILSEFKSRLVAATEPGVDKAKVQDELEQYKQQVLSIANASSFAGENWLNTSVDLTKKGTSETSVVSSFVRGADGQSSVKSVPIDLARTSLFNAGGGGLLQAEKVSDVDSLGGLYNRTLSARGGYQFWYAFPGTTVFTPTDSVTFDITLDRVGGFPGQTFTGLTIDYNLVNSVLGKTDGTMSSPFDFMRVINAAFVNSGVPAGVGASGWVDRDYGYIIISSSGIPGAPENNVELSNVNTTLPGGLAMGLNTSLWRQDRRDYAEYEMEFDEPFDLSGSNYISFNIEVNNGATQAIMIDSAVAQAAIGHTSINSALDMAKLMNYALRGQGMTVKSDKENIVFSVDPSVHPEKGSLSNFRLYNVAGTAKGKGYDFLDIDITSGVSTDRYLTVIEKMLQKATSSAAALGATQSRIEMQQDFASKLTDSLDRGVGRLVDADMNETSTRLKALQTQQQLAVQSLSIANNDAQNLMSLFR